MKQGISFSLAVLACMGMAFSPVAHASSPFGPAQTNDGIPDNQNPTPVLPVTPPPATSPTTVPTGSGGGSNITGTPINDSSHGSAQHGQNTNNSSGNIATAIGAALTAAGAAMMPGCCGAMGTCCPAAVTTLMMGMMGLMQGAGNKSTAGQHGMVKSSVGVNGTPSEVQRPGFANPDAMSSAAMDPQISKGLNALSKVGAKVDLKGKKITFPNGVTVPLDSLGNPDALAKAGVTNAQFKDMMKKIGDLEKAETAKAGLENLPSSEFESGGRGSTTVVASEDEYGYGSGQGAGAAAREPAAASVAGMTVNYNGDRIGVAGDDIFLMMTRRYQQKSREDAFLPPESSPAPFGAPTNL